MERKRKDTKTLYRGDEKIMSKKLYEVVEDLQGGEFGMGRQYTIEEWKQQALEWAWQDDAEELIEFLENMKEAKIIEFIEWVWDLKIEEVKNNEK